MSLFLRTYCRISKEEIHVNGELLYQHLASEVPFFKAVYQRFGLSYPKFFKMDKLSRLGLIGSEMTLMRSQLEEYADDEVALVFSNSTSSGATDLRYFDSLQSGMASPSLFVYTLPNIVVGEVSIRHKYFGENNFFVTERFDAGTLLDYCQSLFDDHAAKAVLLGWAEVSGEKPNGFFAFVTDTGTEEITADKLLDLYLDR